MMDIGTGLSVLGSAPLVLKILGPTAEYIGESLRDFTKKRVANISSIFRKVEEHVNQNDLKGEGVDPYLVKTIFDYGSYSEDEFIQNYLAGLLVSSLNSDANDNRPAVYASIIQSMSSYQVRTHYLIYRTFHELYRGLKVNLTDQKQAEMLQTYVSSELLAEVVFKTDYDKENSPYLFEHIMHGLNRVQLISPNFAFGSAAHISTFGPPSVRDPGILFQPSVFGIELFLWVTTKNEKSFSGKILDENLSLPEFVDIDISGKAFKMPTR